MSEFSVSLKGDDKIRATLQRMSVKMRGKALLDAAKAGATIYRDAARDAAPVRKGSKGGRLKRQIQARRTGGTADSVTFAVSWRLGRSSRTSAFYGLFFHGKAKNRQRKGKGKRPTFGSTGSMPTNRFLDRAFDESTDKVERAVAQVLKRAVEAEARG